ncbi:rod-determining factor RdfA [Haloferax profundi]|uniref:rod-determining factor RdfA n=1 Tax=Haloferax profundi TaxID=1544718 RepID=UPI0009EA979E|nr:rod-determining factor RdfA [Haloferax profundi]
MRNTNQSISRRGGKGPKIERIATRYGLTDLGDDLVAAWLGDGREQQSLRELETHVNKRLVQAALEQAGAHVLDGEVDNFYRLLTSDEVTAGSRTEARNALREKGVDIDQLESDIISYQSVYNYLKQHRNVERERTDDESAVESGLNTIRKLRSRLRTVTIDVIDRLIKSNEVDIGPYEVDVDIRITCTDCEKRMTPTALFSSGHCDCGQPARDATVDEAQTVDDK